MAASGLLPLFLAVLHGGNLRVPTENSATVVFLPPSPQLTLAASGSQGQARAHLTSRCHKLGDTACAGRTFTPAREPLLALEWKSTAPHNFSFKLEFPDCSP